MKRCMQICRLRLISMFGRKGHPVLELDADNNGRGRRGRERIGFMCVVCLSPGTYLQGVAVNHVF